MGPLADTTRRLLPRLEKRAQAGECSRPCLKGQLPGVPAGENAALCTCSLSLSLRAAVVSGGRDSELVRRRGAPLEGSEGSRGASDLGAAARGV